MNKINLPILMIVALVLAAIVATQAFYTSSGTEKIIQSYSGTGESVRLILEPPSMHARDQESAFAGSDWIERHPPSVLDANTHTGSDWIEHHPTGKEGVFISKNGIQESGHTYAGTGDSIRFNFKTYLRNAKELEMVHTYAGTGDPYRYRAPSNSVKAPGNQ